MGAVSLSECLDMHLLECKQALICVPICTPARLCAFSTAVAGGDTCLKGRRVSRVCCFGWTHAAAVLVYSLRQAALSLVYLSLTKLKSLPLTKTHVAAAWCSLLVCLWLN